MSVSQLSEIPLEPLGQTTPPISPITSNSNEAEFLLKFQPCLFPEPSTRSKAEKLKELLSKVSALCHEYKLFPEYKVGGNYTLENLNSWIGNIQTTNIREVCQAQISGLTEQFDLQEQEQLFGVGNAAKLCLNAFQAEETTTSPALEEKKLKPTVDVTNHPATKAFEKLLTECYEYKLTSQPTSVQTLTKENVDKIFHDITKNIIEKQTSKLLVEDSINILGETLANVTACFDAYKKLQGYSHTYKSLPTTNSLAGVIRSLSPEKKTTPAIQKLEQRLDKIIAAQKDIIEKRKCYQPIKKTAKQYQTLIAEPWEEYLRTCEKAGVLKFPLQEKTILHTMMQKRLLQGLCELKQTRPSLIEKISAVEGAVNDLFAGQQALANQRSQTIYLKNRKLTSALGLSLAPKADKNEITYQLEHKTFST